MGAGPTYPRNSFRALDWVREQIKDREELKKAADDIDAVRYGKGIVPFQLLCTIPFVVIAFVAPFLETWATIAALVGAIAWQGFWVWICNDAPRRLEERIPPKDRAELKAIWVEARRRFGGCTRMPGEE